MKQRHNRTRPTAAQTKPAVAPIRPFVTPKNTWSSTKPSDRAAVFFASAISLVVILSYCLKGITEISRSDHQRSLLEIHKTSHLPPCSAYRISLNDEPSPYPPAGDKPTIYTDWTVDNKGLDTTSSFIEHYGHIPQYIKMGDALPLFDKAGKLCIMPFRVLIQTLVRKFITVENNIEPLPEKRETNDDLLIFTNQKETPELFDTILNQYDVPHPLSFTKSYVPPEGEYGWTRIFSVMMRRSAHRFHIHNEAWLGQVSGSRMWFLLPPSTPNAALEYKPPACEYLYNREELPKGAMSCIQNPGEVMYLPKNWWHATCGLEEWNLGVGEQLGAPSMSEPRVPEERTEEEWEEKLEECVKGGAYGL